MCASDRKQPSLVRIGRYMELLSTQFRQAWMNINLGEREQVAKAAHEEVREYLAGIAELKRFGFHTSLIGSYVRHTAIWPGKDVDIFGKFEDLTVDTSQPAQVYDALLIALRAKYGARITPQPRSIKISFGPDASAPGASYLKAFGLAQSAARYEFAVDVVPAVRWGKHWGIPNRLPATVLAREPDPRAAMRNLWSSPTLMDRWQETDPERLTQLTDDMNGEFRIGDDGAFCPTTRAIKQVRAVHLDGHKPSGLYYELILLEAFAVSELEAETWPEMIASALAAVGDRLDRVRSQPLLDPVLGHPYAPAPDVSDVQHAARVFRKLSAEAAAALESDRCAAAATWRRIFGENGHREDGWVFPLPDGCGEDGRELRATPNVLVGSSGARGFG